VLPATPAAQKDLHARQTDPLFLLPHVAALSCVRTDIYVTHSGDTFDKAVLKGMSPATRNLLARRQHPQQVADEHIGDLFPSQKQTQLQRLADWIDTRQAIAVCMSWFDCWRRPGEAPSNMPGCPCPLSKKRVRSACVRGWCVCARQRACLLPTSPTRLITG
jgi:hypothetical protein